MKYIGFFICCFLFISCSMSNKKELTIKDIEVYEGTPAWSLANAVKDQNITEIEEIGQREPSLLNFKDPIFGSTLLVWAIGMEKYKSAKALLKAGADPNIITDLGETALFRAVSYSWIDTEANENAKFVKLLLDHGANPNIPYHAQTNSDYTDPIEDGTSPLMHAVIRSFEKSRTLVKGGANINYKTKTKKTAAIKALMHNRVDESYYLIVEKHAEVTDPYYFYEVDNDTSINFEKKHYPIDLLNDWIFELGSEKHQKKMAIVEEFKNQGQNYWTREIPKSTKERIKKIYPDNWKEYLDKY